MNDEIQILPLIYLARHGETAWSISGQHTGLTDLPLTERGERNARRLGERLKTETFARVFSSPLQRASRTCELSGFGTVTSVDDEDVVARADRVIDRLRAIDGNVLLFSHGHFLLILAARWLDQDAASGRHYFLNTTALSILGYHHGQHDPVIRLWNDCNHVGD